jgi:AcrR family transcriptional regulator
MSTSRPTATTTAASPSLRRRGAVLERAILEAALEQLSTVGWNGLTMEGIAACAQTGKAAVYRRWPSKGDLVADALRLGGVVGEVVLPELGRVPDCGSVREDLLQLCVRMREAMYSRSGFALRSVIHECDAATAQRFHEVIFSRVVEPSIQLLREVIRRGIERGDVRPDADDALVADVVPALMMYRSKVCGSEWPEPEIAEVVDRVMLPLLRP